jgi:hypothetical protein
MRSDFRILGLSLILFAGSSACEEIVKYPDTPIIEYKSFTLFSTVDDLGNDIFLGKMEIDFTDGDGDIGIEQPDSANVPDSIKYNLFLTLYEKVNGDFEKVNTLDSAQNFRIPFIERVGQNKTLKGTITLDLEYKTIEYDTICYTFYLLDREFHRSNVDTSEQLIFTGLKL